MHVADVDKGMLGANDIGTLAVAVGQIAAASTGYGLVTIALEPDVSKAITSLART
jgi:hypothetical protein